MAITYGIYLTAKGMTIRFPVNPSEISMEYPETNEHYNVLALGEIVQPRKPGLTKIAWNDGLLPGSAAQSYEVLTSGSFEPPEFYIGFLNGCKEQGTVCTLTIDRHLDDGTPYHTDALQVVVGRFSVSEKGGETGDFYYAIEFEEYRNYLPGAVTLTKTSGVAQVATAPQRAVPAGQLTVGATVIVTGSYYYDSYGAKPSAAGNGRSAVVGRILTAAGRPRPILVKTPEGGLLGWCGKDDVTTR